MNTTWVKSCDNCQLCFLQRKVKKKKKSMREMKPSTIWKRHLSFVCVRVCVCVCVCVCVRMCVCVCMCVDALLLERSSKVLLPQLVPKPCRPTPSHFAEHHTSMLQEQVQFLHVVRNFSQSQLSAHTLVQWVYTPKRSAVTCSNICVHVKDPTVHVRVQWNMETQEHPACATAIK